MDEKEKKDAILNETQKPTHSSIGYEIDYNDYDFESWHINNYRDRYKPIVGSYTPLKNFAKEASSNTSAVPVGPTAPPPPPPPPNPPT